MFAYIWPLVLIVLSNVAYQLCAKSVPGGMDPMASLTVTYLVGAAASAALYFLLGGRRLTEEYAGLNWVPVLLGLAIVGLEAGFIFAYRAGWQVSTLSVVQGTILAVTLIFAGRLLYREALSWNKLVGIAICLVGLAFINYK